MKHHMRFAGAACAALSVIGLLVASAPAAAQQAQKTEAAPPKKISVSTVVYFDPGKSELRPDARAKIDEMIGKLGAQVGNNKVETASVIGIAARLHNEIPLAFARVDLIREYLEGKGIVPTTFHRETDEEYPPPSRMDGPETPDEWKHASRVEIELSGYRAAAQ